MIVKNVSTKVIRLTDFPDEKPVLPGQQVDLSKYSPAERAQSDELQGLFQRGHLVCLGFAPTAKRLESNKIQKNKLTKYKFEEEDLSLNETLVPASQMQPINNAIPRRDRLPHAPTTPERYNKDALDQYRYEIEVEGQQKTPAFQEKQFEPQRTHSFVQVQNEDEVYTMSLDEQTGAVFQEQSIPGQIRTDFATDPNVFIDKKVYTVEEVEKAEKQKQIIKENLSKIIEKRVSSKCLFPRSDGKPCQRQVHTGYNRCYRHLPAKDQAEIRDKALAKPKEEVSDSVEKKESSDKNAID